MEFSKEEIMSFVGGLGVSRILAGRFRKQVLEHFPGARLFLKASDRELAASGVHGKAMEALVRKVKEEFYLRERDDKARIAQDERVVAYQRKLKEDYEKRLEAMNAEFSLSELQGIVSMMQLMNLDAVDLRLINQFMASVKAKARSTEVSA